MSEQPDANAVLLANGADGLRECFDKAQRQRKPNRQDSSGPAKSRPLIKVSGGSLADNTQAALSVLSDFTLSNPFSGIYTRGSLLVRPIPSRHTHASGAMKDARGPLALIPVTED